MHGNANQAILNITISPIADIKRKELPYNMENTKTIYEHKAKHTAYVT